MFFNLALPVVRPTRRTTPLLQPTVLTADDTVPGLNLTRNCMHRCTFCPFRGHPGGEIETIDGLAERLERELQVRRPRAVLLSPSSDPFPPVDEVQLLAAQAIRTLTRNGVPVRLATRGLIRTPALEAIAEHPDRVSATLPLTTLDRSLQRRLEPWTAPPQLRLDQVERLRSMGVSVQVALEPLLPGVTDTPEHLQRILEALAEIGVRQVTTGYLFLARGADEALERELRGTGLAEVILPAFAGGPILPTPELAPARYLPKARRQRGYARVMALGAAFGIRVRVSAASNPDFTAPRRPEAASPPRPGLRALFTQTSGAGRG